MKNVFRVFLEVLGVIPECFKCVPRKFREKFQDISKQCHVAWHSSQLSEQKEGLFS